MEVSKTDFHSCAENSGAVNSLNIRLSALPRITTGQRFATMIRNRISKLLADPLAALENLTVLAQTPTLPAVDAIERQQERGRNLQ